MRNYSTESPEKAHEFKAETRKILDIVARSLYSEKEVFVRELVSNASDALEKVRFTELSGERKVADPTVPLEIRLFCDSTNKTFTIQDTGIGMTEEEATQNLGTIAHSGSKAFMEKMGALKEGNSGENIIGQFGVGFYSSFMVGNRVKVYTKSAYTGDGIEWESDGAGHYTIRPYPLAERGTKIVIELKDNCKEFSSEKFVESIIKRYSNFIGFPIYLNDKKVDTLEPLWMLPKSQVTPEQHKEFYKFVSGLGDEHTFHLSYSVDSPVMIRSVFYAPSKNIEKFGVSSRFQPGVNLYSRKVLIQPKSKKLLPEWLRFIQGACDSEDIPLNLSREMLQDSSLLEKIRNTLTNRIIKWFMDEARADPAKFNKFYSEFDNFFDEAIVTDPSKKDMVLPLLRFETTHAKENELVGLDEYIARAKESQGKKIYYLAGGSKEAVLGSPYMEQFKDQDVEVLVIHKPFGDFMMKHLEKYHDFEFASVDSEALDQSEEKKEKSKKATEENKDFLQWLHGSLGSKVSEVTVSPRVFSHPALISDRSQAMFQKMMELAQKQKLPAFPHKLEINPQHPIIQKLNHLRKSDKALADLVAEQVFESAKLAAGLQTNMNEVVANWHKILEQVLPGPQTPETPEAKKKN